MRVATIVAIAFLSAYSLAGEVSDSLTQRIPALSSRNIDLSGSWTLQIANLQNQVMANLTIQFRPEPAKSCMVGDWKRIVVTAQKSANAKFFPISEPLSYEIDDEELTIGRNSVCDNYLHLRGKLRGNTVRGIYHSFGLSGGRRLGSFTLRRAATDGT